MKRGRLLVLGLCLTISAVALVNGFYGAITGESLTSDAEYSTFGRVLSAVSVVLMVFIAVWAVRTLRRIHRELDELERAMRERQREAETPSITYDPRRHD